MVTHPPTMGIAEFLRDWRKRQRVSQLELALRAGTTQRHVSFIERGRSLPELTLEAFLPGDRATAAYLAS